MILAHSEIKRLIEEKNILENHEDKNIEGAGVDIRVGKFYKLKTGARLGVNDRVLPEIEETEGDKIILKPNKYIVVETIEKVNIPPELCARMLPRSTLQRSGVYLFHAFIDPGYNGTLIFGMKNIGDFDFELERGSRIAQIIFEEIKGSTKEYEGRYQGGKVI